MVFRHIKDLRMDNDKKQRELAEYLHCSQRLYCAYEKGEVRIPAEVLVELSVYYGTSVDYLLDLTNEKEPYPRNDKI